MTAPHPHSFLSAQARYNTNSFKKEADFDKQMYGKIFLQRGKDMVKADSREDMSIETI